MKESENNFYTRRASIVCLISLIFFTYLFSSDSRISGVVYLGLASLSALCGLIIYFSNSIKEFNLKEMKVILEKTQTVKQEINETALNMVEIMAYQSVYSSGSWLNRKKLNDKIETFLDNVNIDFSKKQSILELPRLMEKFMKDKESLTETEKEKVEKVFELKE